MTSNYPWKAVALVTLVIAITYTSRAQHIEYHSDSMGYRQSIYFIKGNDTLSSYNIKENSPFLDLDIKKINKDKGYASSYKVDSIRLKDLVTDPVVYKDVAKGIWLRNTPIIKARGNTKVLTINPKYAVVIYHLYLHSKRECIGVLAHAKVINRKGENIIKISNTEGIRQISIMENEKYLCYTYGASTEKGLLTKQGVRLIDIKSNDLVVEVETTTSTSINHIDEIIYFHDYYKHNWLVVVLDTENLKLYSKLYSHSELEVLRDIDSKGLYFTQDNGGTKIHRFRKHFYTSAIVQ